MISLPSVPSDRPRIFISYARDDDEAFAKRLWLDLEKHGFSVWWDREAMESRGLSFLREIRDAIIAAARVLLIVGPRVKHSPYVEMEWRHALREGVVVTPFLRLGDYTDVPEALRLLHCEDVRSSIKEAEALDKVQRIVSTQVPPLGPLVGVPRLPTPYLERPDRLDQLRSRVLIDSYRPIDLQADQRITSLTGIGGVGKSVLAAALAQAADVRRSFQDGIYWIAVGRDANTLRTLIRVGLAVGDDAVDRYQGVPEARLLLERALARKNCLLVLDDIWNVEVAEALHTAAGKNVRILLTGRKQRLFASTGVHEIPVDELSRSEALKLLVDWTGTPPDQLPPEAVEITKECGNLPLALAMIGATIRGRPDRWSHALERLRQADLSKIQRKLPDYEYESLDRAMLVSFEDLDADRQRRYLDLVAIPEEASAPAAMLHAWWAYEGMNELDIDEVLDELVDRSLLRVDERHAYSLHDVQRDFLVMRTECEGVLHTRWLAAFASHTPDGWAAAEDDGYLFDHLGHHLRGAGREDEWRGLLVSFSWLERKTRVSGFPAVVLDLAAYSADSVIGPVHRACRRAAHILTNDPAQLAAQLLARIDATPALEPLLNGARAWHGGPWLRPVIPSLGEEGEPTLAIFRGREKDGHAGTPRSIALSEDGNLIASGGGSSNDLTVKIWSASAGILLRTYEREVEAGGFTALAFVAADGRLAGASRDEVRLYAVDADQPVARRTFDGAYVSCICGGGRNGVVFVGFEDGRVLAWDPRTDATAGLREAVGDRVIALACASASPRLAIVTASAIECRDARDGQLIGRLEEALGGGRFLFQAPLLVITPNGSRVFFGDPARAWTVGEPAAGALMEKIDGGRVVDLTDDGAVALTAPDAPDGRELVAIEMATGRRIGWIRNSCEFSCLALARDGRVVATGDREHDVKLWDLTRTETQQPERERRGRIRSVAICDDRSLALVATDDMHELWGTETGTRLEEHGSSATVRAVRHGTPLLDTRVRQEVRARLKEPLRRIAQEVRARSEEELDVSGYDLRLMSPVEAENDILTDGQNLIIVADVRDTLHFRIFDADGRRVVDTDETELAIFTSGPEQIAELKKNLSGLWQNPQLSRSDKDRVSSSVRSAVGRHYVHHYDDTFASIMGHDYVSYYDIAFLELADLSDDFFFNSTDWPMSALAFSLKAGRAVTAPAWGAKGPDEEEGPYDPRYPYSAYPLQLWDFEHIREPRPLNGHTSPIMCADMTGGGKWALTGSRGRMLRLWDLDSGVCLQIMRGHRGIVSGCALSEDARLAVSGSEDMTVRLWDLVQGKLLFTFAVSSAVVSCDIARDGSVAIAAEVSGRVHILYINNFI